MKYFTYSLIAAANEWIDQTEKQAAASEKLFWSTAEKYNDELDTLRPRVSKKAWEFFRYGFERHGLHDGRLLSLCTGDGLNYAGDGRSPFLLNRQRAGARIELLNREQDFHYTFEFKGLNRVICDLFEGDPGGSIGDLFIYELTAVDAERLQLGFLFASGASIVVRFRKLVFRRTRISQK
jgi:hypothetical protein